MRVINIGNKIRTGAMALAMMHTVSPAVNAAEKLGAKTGLYNKAATEIKMATDSISEAASSVKWKDVEGQLLAKANVYQETKNQAVQDITTAEFAKPNVSWRDSVLHATSAEETPAQAEFLGELEDYRVFKIPKDSIKAFYSDLEELKKFNIDVKVAVPKDNKNVSVDDCIFQTRLKTSIKKNDSGETVKRAGASYIKGPGPMFVVDSTQTIGPNSRWARYSYSRDMANDDLRKVGMVKERVPGNELDQFGVYDDEGNLKYLNDGQYSSMDKYFAIQKAYKSKLEKLLNPYQPLIGDSGFGD